MAQDVDIFSLQPTTVSKALQNKFILIDGKPEFWAL